MSEKLKSPGMFSVRRTFYVSTRVLRQFVRDRRTFGMMIMMPILIMLIFGFALSGEVTNVPIIVQNSDQGATVFGNSVNFGSKLTDSLGKDSRVSVTLGDYQAGITEIDNAKGYFASILIPKNFTNEILAKLNKQPVNITINLYIDKTKPAIRASILGAIGDAIKSLSGQSFINVDEIGAFGGASYSGLDVAVPSVMGLVLTFLVLLVSLLTAIREDLGGTKFRLLSTPLTAREKVIGYVAALTLFALVEAMLVLVFGVYLFGATVKGNIWLLVFSAFIYGMVNVFLAIFLSNFVENELQAVQMGPLIAFPSMALSGMLVPVESMPPVAQFFSQFIPMTYAINIFEGIMLKGFSFDKLVPQFQALGIFALIFLLFSFLSSRDTMK